MRSFPFARVMLCIAWIAHNGARVGRMLSIIDEDFCHWPTGFGDHLLISMLS
jgi:hypothetical protein